MNKIVLLLLILFFATCKKEEVTLPNPYAANRVQNSQWASFIPSHPQWEYSFSDGILIQSLPVFSTIVTQLTFPYATRSDTIYIGGDTNNPPRTWTVYFHCDSILEVHQLGAVINETIYLKRIAE